ncbi:hypothetical protein HK104_009232 [Borealophlyctis nickersoniae]|nr:hypothetical protein HK104_009232 [Borealophlyctis nickersoniae]
MLATPELPPQQSLQGPAVGPPVLPLQQAPELKHEPETPDVTMVGTGEEDEGAGTPPDSGSSTVVEPIHTEEPSAASEVATPTLTPPHPLPPTMLVTTAAPSTSASSLPSASSVYGAPVSTGVMAGGLAGTVNIPGGQSSTTPSSAGARLIQPPAVPSPVEVPPPPPPAPKKSHKAKNKSKGKEKEKEKEREERRESKNKEKLKEVAKEEEKMEVDDEEDPEQQLTKKEKRHKEFNIRLEMLEREFAERREGIFNDKISLFKQEMREVQEGIHPDFEDSVNQLAAERDWAIKKAELFRNYQIECANHLYQIEHETSMREYMQEKQSLRERMISGLEERKRKLKDDRENFDINNVDAAIEAQKTIGTRKATRATAAKQPEEKKEKRRKVTNMGGLVFLLKEHEILDDMGVVRRASFVANAQKKANSQKAAKK